MPPGLRKSGIPDSVLIPAPVKTTRGKVIGVVQALNKRTGQFTLEDLDLLEAMARRLPVISTTLPLPGVRCDGESPITNLPDVSLTIAFGDGD